MTLGSRIAQLRIQHNMSQGDLAEKMNVSRQSVSKWETDSSVPDIDNLVFLSNLFNVTLDELVKGKSPKPAEPTREADTSKTDVPGANVHAISGDTLYTGTQGYSHSSIPVQKPPIGMTQRILGYIFLGTGIFTAVLGLALGFGLIIFVPLLIVYGIICLTVRKHAALWCHWITLLLCLVFMPYFTSLSLSAIYNAYYLADASSYSVHLIVSALFWVWILALSYFTAKATKARNHPMLVTGWVLLFLLRGHIGYGILTPVNFYGLGSLHVTDPIVRANAVVGLVFGIITYIVLFAVVWATIRMHKPKHQ